MIGLAHGQFWWADLIGDKIRPVLILTRVNVAPKLKRVLVAPVTSTDRGLRTEIRIERQAGLADRCVVNFDNVHLLDVGRLLNPISNIDPLRWPEVCRALTAVLDC